MFQKKRFIALFLHLVEHAALLEKQPIDRLETRQVNTKLLRSEKVTESGRVAPLWQPSELNAETEDPISKTTEKEK